MYHNVTNDWNKVDKYTIHQTTLEEHLLYLANKNYDSYHFKDLDNKKMINSGRKVIITFDDVTKSQLKYAVPLLKKYNLKATFFIPFAYVGKADNWNDGLCPIMSFSELKALDPTIELGYHSFLHRPYATLSNQEIIDDTNQCNALIQQYELDVTPVLAYPYGNFPRKQPRKKEFYNLLESLGFKYGLRIGNRRSNVPFRNKYEINRIEIIGNEEFKSFKYKLRIGRIF